MNYVKKKQKHIPASSRCDKCCDIFPYAQVFRAISLAPGYSVLSILSPQPVKATDSSDLIIAPLRVSFHTNQPGALLNKAWQKLFHEQCAGAEVVSPVKPDD